jgi:hypothetical protein
VVIRVHSWLTNFLKGLKHTIILFPTLQPFFFHTHIPEAS